jgi:hypothetical protein
MGTKAANELGIYDISMNVWNPTGPRSGSGWVVRGGSCSIGGGGSGVACRNFCVGFRVARHAAEHTEEAMGEPPDRRWVRAGLPTASVPHGAMSETRHSPPLRKSSTELTLMPERPARTLSA